MGEVKGYYMADGSLDHANIKIGDEIPFEGKVLYVSGKNSPKGVSAYAIEEPSGNILILIYFGKSHTYRMQGVWFMQGINSGDPDERWEAEWLLNRLIDLTSLSYQKGQKDLTDDTISALGTLCDKLGLNPPANGG